MTILLAPMEGLLDFVLRDILTRVGGIDRCVSEFIRITDQLLPERVFTRIVPELLNGGRTLAGVPVRAQLLGSDPSCMADNAALLASLGPAGIDLNFGCPANIVNRHGGGAALLDQPETMAAIVSAVRRSVPAGVPVSAKMRLGYHDDSRAVECALAIAESGAEELVVHARTKAQAYRPPAAIRAWRWPSRLTCWRLRILPPSAGPRWCRCSMIFGAWSARGSTCVRAPGGSSNGSTSCAAASPRRKRPTSKSRASPTRP